MDTAVYNVEIIMV